MTAVVERNGERAAGFQQRKVRRAADRDFSAFDEIDLSLAGFHADVVAAAQHRFDLAVHDFDAHRTLQGDRVAFDGADRVACGLVRPVGLVRGAGGNGARICIGVSCRRLRCWWRCQPRQNRS